MSTEPHPCDLPMWTRPWSMTPEEGAPAQDELSLRAFWRRYIWPECQRRMAVRLARCLELSVTWEVTSAWTVTGGRLRRSPTTSGGTMTDQVAAALERTAHVQTPEALAAMHALLEGLEVFRTIEAFIARRNHTAPLLPKLPMLADLHGETCEKWLSSHGWTAA